MKTYFTKENALKLFLALACIICVCQPFTPGHASEPATGLPSEQLVSLDNDYATGAWSRLDDSERQAIELSDFTSFYLRAAHPAMPEVVREQITEQLMDAAASLGDTKAMRHYLLAAVRELVIDFKEVKKQSSYSLHFFDSSLAADFSKLCEKSFSPTFLKKNSAQLRASSCYFKVLSLASGSYEKAAQFFDHGQLAAKLLRHAKSVAKSPDAQKQLSSLAGLLSFYDDAEAPELVRLPLEKGSVEQLYAIDADPRASQLFLYAADKLSDASPALSLTTLAVKSHTLENTAAAVLPTNEAAMAFIDLLDTVATDGHWRIDSKKRHGAGALTIELATFAAQSCNLAGYAVQQDLDNHPANILLSACLFKETLQRFGGDKELATAAYLALVEGGRLIPELVESPLTRHYPLSELTETLAPFSTRSGDGATSNMLNILAKIVRSPLSPIARLATFSQLSRVASLMFADDQGGQENQLIIWAMESRYDGRQQSETGARGIGQLIPSYVKDFGSSCKMSDVEDSEIADDTVNALLSACYFRDLVEQHNGMVTVALAAYNAGLNSSDVHNFKNLSSMGNEPANYVARYSLIKERLDLAMVKGAADLAQVSPEWAGEEAPDQQSLMNEATLNRVVREVLMAGSGSRNNHLRTDDSRHLGPRVAWARDNTVSQ